MLFQLWVIVRDMRKYVSALSFYRSKTICQTMITVDVLKIVESWCHKSSSERRRAKMVRYFGQKKEKQ